MATLDENITRLNNGKTAIKTALKNKGYTDDSVKNNVALSAAKIDEIAPFIDDISTGTDTSDATAVAANILSGKTAYVSSGKITGTMTNNGAVSKTLTDTNAYTIPAGYHNGNGKVQVSTTNLSASNIKKGVDILGVTGTYEAAGTEKGIPWAAVKNLMWTRDKFSDNLTLSTNCTVIDTETETVYINSTNSIGYGMWYSGKRYLVYPKASTKVSISGGITLNDIAMFYYETGQGGNTPIYYMLASDPDASREWYEEVSVTSSTQDQNDVVFTYNGYSPSESLYPYTDIAATEPISGATDWHYANSCPFYPGTVYYKTSTIAPISTPSGTVYTDLVKVVCGQNSEGYWWKVKVAKKSMSFSEAYTWGVDFDGYTINFTSNCGDGNMGNITSVNFSSSVSSDNATAHNNCIYFDGSNMTTKFDSVQQNYMRVPEAKVVISGLHKVTKAYNNINNSMGYTDGTEITLSEFDSYMTGSGRSRTFYVGSMAEATINIADLLDSGEDLSGKTLTIQSITKKGSSNSFMIGFGGMMTTSFNGFYSTDGTTYYSCWDLSTSHTFNVGDSFTIPSDSAVRKLSSGGYYGVSSGSGIYVMGSDSTSEQFKGEWEILVTIE